MGNTTPVRQRHLSESDICPNQGTRSNCVVNGELVVHEDGLWLVAPRSPGVYLLEQVAVEGRRLLGYG